VTTGLTISVVGSTGLSAEIGKKGTESDLRLYHHVREGHAVTLIEPVNYPERFGPLLECLALGDEAWLVADRLDRAFAESAATADLFGAPVRLVRGAAVGEEELRRSLRGLSFEGAEPLARDPAALRERLEGERRAPAEGPTLVRLDHAFPVKGVGTVALGFVRQGRLKSHDTLRLYPSPERVEVRSIQVHDVDVTEAIAGERVGVALRGVEPSAIARGATLAPDGALRTAKRFEIREPRKGAYYRGTLAAGRRLQALVGAQLAPAQLMGAEGASWSVEADRELVYAPGDRLLLADLDVPAGPRAAAAGTIA
jgi:selenocysteine-specific translation elongation factor